MKNGDQPAYPDPARGGEEYIGNRDPLGMPNGLTKREAIAIAAMQGMLANGVNRRTKIELVQEAVAHADAILKALEQ